MSGVIVKQKRNSLKTIWYFLRPYKFPMLFLCIVGALNGIFETLHIAVLYPILDGTLGVQSAAGGGFLMAIINGIAKVIPVDDVVIANGIIFIVLTVLFFLSRMVYLVFSLKTTSRIVVDNKLRVFQKYIDSDYQFFIDNKQGELLYKAATAPASLRVLLMTLTRFLVEAILTISIFVLLFSLSWQGGLLVLIVGVGYFYLTRYLGSRISYVTGVGQREATEGENVILTEYIAGIKPIKVFETSPSWQALYDGAVNKFWGLWKRGQFWMQTPTNVVNLLLFSLVAIAVIVIRMQNPANFINALPVIGTFVFAIFKLLPRLSSFGIYMMQIMNALPNVEAIQDILQDLRYSQIISGQQDISQLKTAVEFRNVRFTHKKRKATLKDVSFILNKDKTAAIVGVSGAGKSTIVDLLLRLYDVDDGGIYVDDRNIKDYNTSSLLGAFGFIGQETFIFNASVRDNISFGDNYTVEEVIVAARLANADEFIRQLPEGYDTIVGDRGIKLSGGERQRIAIARAMIRKPQILVLDEATSSLDSISESIVQDAINKVSKTCTTLIIAHRLQTIQNANVIYVLDKGKIVESGTHDQLIRQNGKYQELYNIQ